MTQPTSPTDLTDDRTADPDHHHHHHTIPTATFTVSISGDISPPIPAVVNGYVGGLLTITGAWRGYIWATQGNVDKCSTLVHLPPGETAMEAGHRYVIREGAVSQNFEITTTQPGPPSPPRPRVGTNGDIHVGTPPEPKGDPKGR